MATADCCIAPFKNTGSVPLRALQVDGKKGLVMKVPKFLDCPRLTKTDACFESREVDGTQGCMKFFVRRIIGDSSEVSLVRFKRMHFHDVVNQGQRVSKPRLYHLYKCADGRHSRDDMGSACVRVCGGNNGPRKGQEISKGVKEMPPGTFIPITTYTTSKVSPSKMCEHFHSPGYSVQLKISHICRVHLSIAM